MKICIYGAGAVGGLVAGRLAQSGHKVSVVARGAQLAAIRQIGLRILAEKKEVQIKMKAESDPARLGPQDYVFVAVKGQNLPEVAERIGPLLGKDTSIVTAMNGVPWWFFDRLAFGQGKLRLEIDGLLTGTLEVAQKAGVPAPFTESLDGLIRLRAESTGQYK